MREHLKKVGLLSKKTTSIGQTLGLRYSNRDYPYNHNIVRES
jgi:hypothetical protein